MNDAKTKAFIVALLSIEETHLRWDDLADAFGNCLISPAVFLRGGRVHVRADEEFLFVDFYADLRGGYPYVNQTLQELAELNGGHWAWVGTSSIVFVEN